MSKKLRSYFFDSPASDQGDRFRSKNIPSQETYADLLDSTGFLSEPGDMATATQQGFVKIYTDDEAITARQSAVPSRNEQKVLKASQAPGAGIANTSGGYLESNPTSTADGTPVSGNGIKITGRIVSEGLANRVGHQVELDIRSISPITTTIPPDGTLLAGLFPDGTQGLVEYGASTNPSGGGANYTHSQDVAATLWAVKHNLGYKPGGVFVEIDGQEAEAVITHVDDASLTVELSMVRSGKVYIS